MEALLLGLIAIVTSTFTAIVGVGGGIALLAILLDFFPPQALIPVHALVQLSSNVSRAGFGLPWIQWPIVKNYLWGGLIGGILGTMSINFFPFAYLPLVLGIFTLVMTWLPFGDRIAASRPTFPFLGCLQTYLGFFIGATGPLTHPLLMRLDWDRHQVVSTAGALVCIMHSFKIIGYTITGVSVLPYLAPIAAMSVGAIIGSYLGTRLRSHLSDRFFKILMKTVLTALALRMILRFFSQEAMSHR